MLVELTGMNDTSIFGRLFGRRDGPEPQRPDHFAHLRAPRDGYVFVIGYGLSGDILIQDLLNAVPGVVVRGENGNLLQPISKAWHLAERDVLAAFAAHDHDAFRQFEDLTLLGWHLADSFVRTALALPGGTRMAGFREIRLHGDPAEFKQQLDFMAAFFPTARFIFQTRDVRQVAATGWWRDQDPDEVRQTLSEATRLFELYLAVNPDRSLHMQYDSYIENPAELSGMFDWLGLPSLQRDHMDALVAKHRADLEADGVS